MSQKITAVQCTKEEFLNNDLPLNTNILYFILTPDNHLCFDTTQAMLEMSSSPPQLSDEYLKERQTKKAKTTLSDDDIRATTKYELLNKLLREKQELKEQVAAKSANVKK